MEAVVVTREAPRALVWIALTGVVFVLLLLITTFAAAWISSQLGIAEPEREHFALLNAILLSLSLLAAIPWIGRLLGEGRLVSPGVLVVLAFTLAAGSAYVIFEDQRSGLVFDTDRALQEILVPVAIALLASTDLGRRSATTPRSRHAWSWAGLVGGLIVLSLVALTAGKVIGNAMGMSRLDSPLTFAALALAAVYGITVIFLRLSATSR